MTFITWDTEAIAQLKYPQNRWQLAVLSISQLQIWYLAQDPKWMIFLANTPGFKRFWYFSYILPTKFYRSLLKIKQFLLSDSITKVSA